MAVPPRSKQIAAIAAFLEDPANEDRTVTDVATRIVDGMYDMWEADTQSPPVPLSVGMAFKTPWSSKVMHVAWIGEFWSSQLGLHEAAWVVSADSEFGSLTPTNATMWRVVQLSKAKAGAPGNNASWSPGDRARCGSHLYEVLATGDKCVLLRDASNPYALFANSNESMARFYTRET